MPTLPDNFFAGASVQAESAVRSARELDKAVESPTYATSTSLLVSRALDFGVAVERLSNRLEAGFAFVFDSISKGPQVSLSTYAANGAAADVLSLSEFADLVEAELARASSGAPASGE